jgi:hypothetical protein
MEGAPGPEALGPLAEKPPLDEKYPDQPLADEPRDLVKSEPAPSVAIRCSAVGNSGKNNQRMAQTYRSCRHSRIWPNAMSGGERLKWHSARFLFTSSLESASSSGFAHLRPRPGRERPAR